MRRKIVSEIEEFADPGQLRPDDLILVNSAKEATAGAYAPYSGFRVGAAVRLKSGKILTGNNRENAAFPSGTCAEGTVISYTGANHPNDPIVAMAIAASVNEQFSSEPVSPCGNCRQIIAEEEDRTGEEIRLILYGESKIEIIEGVSPLLPLRFNKDKLKA